MLTQIYMELYKFKRSKILWAIIALLTVHLFWSFLQGSTQRLNWNEFLNAQYMNLWIHPAFFTFLTGYLFVRDYEEKGVSNLFAYPFSRGQWYFAKLITSFLIIALILLASFGIDLAIGLLLLAQPLSFSILIHQLVLSIEVILFFGALSPISAMIGIWLRKYALCLAVSLFVLFISALFGTIPKYITLDPWLLPYLFSHYPQNLSNISPWIPGVYVSVIMIVFSGLLGYHHYIKMDVVDR